MSCRCPGRRRSGTRRRGRPRWPHAAQRSGSPCSLRRVASIRADLSVGAAEPAQAGAYRSPRRRREVAGADSPDRVDRRGTTALQVLLADGALHPLPNTQRRLAEGEQDLAHASEYRVLGVPEGEEPRAQCNRPPLLVDTVATGQVVHEELNVGKLGPEVVVVGVLGAAAAAGLVVHDLAGALAGVVYTVDLSVDLGTVDPQRELALDHHRAKPPDRLQAGRKSNVVVEDAPHLLLLRPAIQDRVDAVQVALEMLEQRLLQPFPLQLVRELAPLGLTAVEILEHTM